MIATIIGITAAAAWLCLIAGRGLFWRVHDNAVAAAPAPSRSVVAVIPARDEAEVIGCAVGSLTWTRPGTPGPGSGGHQG